MLNIIKPVYGAASDAQSRHRSTARLGEEFNLNGFISEGVDSNNQTQNTKPNYLSIPYLHIPSLSTPIITKTRLPEDPRPRFSQAGFESISTKDQLNILLGNELDPVFKKREYQKRKERELMELEHDLVAPDNELVIGETYSMEELEGLESTSKITPYSLIDLDSELLKVYESPEIDRELENLFNSDLTVRGLESAFVDGVRDDIYDLAEQEIESEYGFLSLVQDSCDYGDALDEEFDRWSDSEIDLLYEHCVEDYDLDSELRIDNLDKKFKEKRDFRAYRIESAVYDSLMKYDLEVQEEEEKSLTEQYYNILNEYDAFTKHSEIKGDHDYLKMYWRERKWIQKNRNTETDLEYSELIEEYDPEGEIDMLEHAYIEPSSAVYTLFGRAPGVPAAKAYV